MTRELVHKHSTGTKTFPGTASHSHQGSTFWWAQEACLWLLESGQEGGDRAYPYPWGRKWESPDNTPNNPPRLRGLAPREPWASFLYPAFQHGVGRVGQGRLGASEHTSAQAVLQTPHSEGLGRRGAHGQLDSGPILTDLPAPPDSQASPAQAPCSPQPSSDRPQPEDLTHPSSPLQNCQEGQSQCPRWEN